MPRLELLLIEVREIRRDPIDESSSQSRGGRRGGGGGQMPWWACVPTAVLCMVCYMYGMLSACPLGMYGMLYVYVWYRRAHAFAMH